MIKDIFILRPTAWHARLMRYIWGFKYYDFSHICPYFWLSLLNIITIIPYVIVRYVLVYPLDKVISMIGDMKEARSHRKGAIINGKYEYYINFFTLHGKLPDLTGVDPMFADSLIGNILGNYYGVSPEEYQKIWDALAPLRAIRDAPLIARMKRKDQINHIVSIVKPIFMFLALGVTVLVGWLGVWGLYWVIFRIIPSSTHKFWMNFLLTMGIGIVFAFVLALIIYLYEKILDRVRETRRRRTTPIILGVVFKGIGYGFEVVFAVISNACPAIKWQDDKS